MPIDVPQHLIDTSRRNLRNFYRERQRLELQQQALRNAQRRSEISELERIKECIERIDRNIATEQTLLNCYQARVHLTSIDLRKFD